MILTLHPQLPQGRGTGDAFAIGSYRIVDKTLRRVTDLEEQQDETYRYWQSQPVGDRLIAVCELSQAAYDFAASFKKGSDDAAQGLQRSPSSFE
jgi:hypothetical protein